jgi:hypothetical protein
MIGLKYDRHDGLKMTHLVAEVIRSGSDLLYVLSNTVATLRVSVSDDNILSSAHAVMGQATVSRRDSAYISQQTIEHMY